MFPKAHLTSHSRRSGSRWVIIPSWLFGSWRSYLCSSVYSCHLFLISSASVRSLLFLSFVVPIFIWNVPLVSLIFLKRSLVFPILLFPSISLLWSLRKAFLSLLDILWNSAFKWVYLSFSPELYSVSKLHSVHLWNGEVMSPARFAGKIKCAVQFSCSVNPDSLGPHGLQHAKPSCPSPTPGVYSTHVHWVSDAIQPSHVLSSPSPPAFNLFQHQGLFQWVSSSHQVAKVLEFQLQHQSFQWIVRTDFF